MAKLNAFALRKAIPREEFDYPLLKAALSSYDAVPQKINELLRSGVIVRVKKGLYVFGAEYTQSPICKEVLANLIYGPSCISLEYALSYHGLIPERVETLTSVTPKRDKAFMTPVGAFTYRYLGNEKYPQEIERVWIDSEHPVLMASPEKALCDYLVLNKVREITSPESALKWLESDLRIDQKQLRKLDPIVLRNLNRSYRNQSIEHVVEAT